MTLTSQEADFVLSPLEVAVTVQLPLPTAVTTPYLLTVAMLSSLEDQVTVSSGVPQGVTEAVSFTFAPLTSSREVLSRLTAISPFASSSLRLIL